MAISPRIIEILKPAPSGAPGASGFSGYSGRSGNPGHDGNPGGASGYSGFSGSGGGGLLTNHVSVMDYGAVADLATIYTGAITAGTNSLNVSPSTFVTGGYPPSPDGKLIYVRGAGVGGVTLETTVVSHSGSIAILAVNASTTVSGQRVDYGTANAAAFNAALLAVQFGGTVHVPAGYYLLGTSTSVANSRVIIDYNNIVFQGDGLRRTNLFYSSNRGAGATGPGTGIFCGNTIGNHRESLTLKDFTIRDLSLTSQAFSHQPAAIEVFAFSNITLDSVEIIDSKGNSGLNIQGAETDCTVKNCIIRADTGNFLEGDGINIGQFSRVNVVNNYIYKPTRHGYEGGGQCFDQYIAFNTVDMAGGGLSGINPTGGNRTVVHGNNILNLNQGYGVDFTCDNGAFVSKDNRIIGNYIQMITSSGFSAIRIQNTSGDTSVIHVDRFLVMGNQIDNLGTTNKGMYIGESSANMPEVTIVGNRFNINNAGSGVGIYIASAAGTPTRYILVKGNIFLNCFSILSSDAGYSATAERHVICDDNIATTPAVDYYGGYSSFNFGGGNIAAGGIVTAAKTIFNSGANDIVVIVPPVAMNTNLITWGVITTNGTGGGTVTLSQYNPTAAPIASVNVKAYLRRAQSLP